MIFCVRQTDMSHALRRIKHSPRHSQRILRRVLISSVCSFVLGASTNSVALAVGNPSTLPSFYCSFSEEPRTALLSTEGLVVVNDTKATAYQFQSADVAQPKPEYRFVKGPTLTINEPDEPGNRAAFLDDSLGACARAPQDFVPRAARVSTKMYSTASTKSATVTTLAAKQIVFVGAAKKGWREVFVSTPRATGLGLVTRSGWVSTSAVETRPVAKL
jgi:hypothetical protein